MQEVRCNECERIIESRDELYTYLSVSGIHGLCGNCYVRKQKSINAIGTPLNGQATMLTMIVAIVGCGLLFIRYPSWIWIVVIALVPVPRILSWFLIERKIKS